MFNLDILKLQNKTELSGINSPLITEAERQAVVWRVVPENLSSKNDHKSSNSFCSLHSQMSKVSSFKNNGSELMKNGVNGTGSVRPAFPKTSANHSLSSKPNRFEFSTQNGNSIRIIKIN